MTTDAQMTEPDSEPTRTPDHGVQAGAPESTAGDTDDSRSARLLGQNADVRHVALLILTLLALLYTLRFAQAFFLPIVLAILLNLLLSPIVRLLRNSIRIPEPLGAGIVIMVLLGVLGFGVYRLTPAASAWVARAPESLATLQRRFSRSGARLSKSPRRQSKSSRPPIWTRKRPR